MRKVLVVEDEELIRKGIVLTVDWASLGCVVAGEAANGEEGLAAEERLKPELIVTDLKMPKLDGISMLERLRERGCEAQVIILTAYDSFSYAQQALRLGAVDFLLKPFHDGELEEAVLRLRKKKGEGAAGEQQALLPDLKKSGLSRYVARTVKYISEHYGEEQLTLKDMAEALGISEGHLSHTFKKETDLTPLSYLTRYRIRKAIGFLKTGDYKVYEVAERVGYRDIAYFSASFKKMTGRSPSEYLETGGNIKMANEL